MTPSKRDTDLAHTMLRAFQCRDTCFDAQLFQLIAKADATNMQLLSQSFPDYVRIYREWWDCPKEEEFWVRYGWN